jgi:catechol 2,3-dioxygenase-like lactoylglutathione lyase family enzyme
VSTAELSTPELAAEAPGLLLGGRLDLADITGLTLAAIVPGFAEGAGVFVLEHLLKGGEPAGLATGGEVVTRRLGTTFARAGQRVSREAFPPGQVLAFAPSSPYARCMDTGGPVVFAEPDGPTLELLRPDGREVVSGCSSFLVVPLTARDTVVGMLAFARDPGAPAFSRREIATAARLGAQAGTAIVNALTLMRHRSIANALQRGLLAAEPPMPSGLEVAGRCLPAAGQVIGGDWYDIIPLDGNRTGLVVGDVMGHGPEAAAVMAQLRAAAHALADLDLEPADLLQRLNRVTATLQRITLATCAYAVVDADGHTCTLAGAGHLPPILALPDGTTRVPELPAGQSLGLGTAIYGQARIKLPPGAVLALYTDGLVESRTRSFDQGILAMRSILARQHGHLEAVRDALIASLAGRCEDDITVILARIPAGRAG